MHKYRFSQVVCYSWGIYLALSPLYLWQSGLPQIADFFLASVILASASSGKMKVPAWNLAASIGVIGFLVVVWLVSMVHAMTYSPKMLMDPLRLTYNVIVFLFCASCITRDAKTFMIATFYGIVVGYILIILSFDAGGGTRETASFNNPNQLAYMGVLSLAMCTYCLYWRVISAPRVAVVVVLISGVSMLGISFAAALCVGSALLMFLWVLGGGLNRWRSKGAFVILALVFLGAAAIGIDQSKAPKGTSAAIATIEGVAFAYQRRIESKLDEKLDGLATGEDRGLSVFKDHPENIIWGAGRGGNERYGQRWELHASLPAVLYSFGLLGFFFFVLFLAGVYVRSARLTVIAISIPVWLWSFAHYGLNFPLLWAMLALLCVGTRSIDRMVSSGHSVFYKKPPKSRSVSIPDHGQVTFS